MTGWVIAWAAIATAVVLLRMLRHTEGVGLVLAFIVNLAISYWVGAAIALLPWYPRSDTDVLFEGFRQATFALIAFGFAVVFLAPRYAQRQTTAPVAIRTPSSERGALAYTATGLLFFLVLFPAVGTLPSASALVNQGWDVIVAGLALGCWWAWCRARPLSFGRWLAGALCLPLITILIQGFLGFGTIAAIAVLCFVGSFYRPRWRVLLAAALLMYVGLSLYVTYMRDRDTIRAAVWSGAPMSERVNRLYTTLTSVEGFDPHNTDHLESIAARMNQNNQVGEAVRYIDAGFAQFAYGQTLVDGAVSVIPRAVWPTKPVVVGGSSVVSRYTGRTFDPTTSVGIGNVMEAYISFGTVGVIAWFALLGVILSRVDAAALAHLRTGEWPRFVQWYLPGLSLLAIGGSLVDLTSTTAAAVIVAFLVNRLLARGDWANSKQSAGLTAVRVGRAHIFNRVGSSRPARSA